MADMGTDIQRLATAAPPRPPRGAPGRDGPLEELLASYLVPVRNLVLQMVGNEADADDLTQEALLRAYRNLHRFEGRSELSTWVYRIATNTACSFLRARRRHGNEPLEAAAEPTAPARQAPDSCAAGRELDGRIGAALDRLSPSLRAAIVLTVMQDLPAKTAAQIAGCPTATLYWRVFQARRQLRRDLAEFLDR